MTEESQSHSCTSAENNKKVEFYLKRPEDLVFETDFNFLTDIESMYDLAVRFKKDRHLTYLPKEIKGNEEFMLKLIGQRANAYDYASQKLSKSPEFAIKAIKANPEAVDSVFFKHENFFNNLQVVNEALKHEQSDFYNVSQEIEEYIHKKNVCTKEDLLEMFGGKSRCSCLVKFYDTQVSMFIDDVSFKNKVSEKNDFDFTLSEVSEPVSPSRSFSGLRLA